MIKKSALSIIRKGFFQGLLLLIIGILALGYASLNAWVKYEEYKKTSLSESNARDRLASAASEEQELREVISDYSHFVKKGVIGPENRLEWVEIISDIIKKHRIFGFSYEFSPQKTLENSYGVTASFQEGHRIVSSEMSLVMDFLHTEDFLSILMAFQTKVPALVITKSCEVLKFPIQGEHRLRAKCLLDWVTVNER